MFIITKRSMEGQHHGMPVSPDNLIQAWLAWNVSFQYQWWQESVWTAKSNGKESVLWLWLCYLFIYLVGIKTRIIRKALVIQIARFYINKINIKSTKIHCIRQTEVWLLCWQKERLTQWDVSSLGQSQFSLHREKKTNRAKIDLLEKTTD